MGKVTFYGLLLLALAALVFFGMVGCSDNPGNAGTVVGGDSTGVVIPGDTTGTPPDTAVINPPDTSIINPPDTSVINPPDTSIINPPDTAVINPPDTTVINPPDTSVINPPDTAVINPPDTSVINPPDTSVINPPDTTTTPPDTSVIPPPMTPRDSLLNYIDRNWQLYGYASKPTKYAALTFDDGPGSQTGSLLSALESKKVKATFFLIGQNIRGNQSQAKAIHDAGHELANHSDGYSGLGGSTAANTISASLTAATTAIKGITGKDVKLFRAPSVEYGSNLTAVCTQQGLAIIGVSIWSQDYQSGITSSAIANNVLNNAADGGIINCHEPNTAPNTVAAIPAMIDGLRQKGFWICTVSDLAAIKGRTLQAGVRYDTIQ
ncbi:MAG: polysaccharide deacetylase family protein [Chitinispirillia bacterium]|nr:polysaccharide deacetylase family protein [Chitinispirillia bacterium]MCL2242795.1 polysaccharide deacetylase family protein [Chitinispirillia bacterium]